MKTRGKMLSFMNTAVMIQKMMKAIYSTVRIVLIQVALQSRNIKVIDLLSSPESSLGYKAAYIVSLSRGLDVLKLR